MTQIMSEEEYINRLQMRVSNLERALFHYFAITKDILPPAMLFETESMFEDFFYAQASLHVKGKMGGPNFQSDKDLNR